MYAYRKNVRRNVCGTGAFVLQTRTAGVYYGILNKGNTGLSARKAVEVDEHVKRSRINVAKD